MIKLNFFYILYHYLVFKNIFHGSGFDSGFNKTFFCPWFSYCAGCNKLMSTWVRDTRNLTMNHRLLPSKQTGYPPNTGLNMGYLQYFTSNIDEYWGFHHGASVSTGTTHGKLCDVRHSEFCNNANWECLLYPVTNHQEQVGISKMQNAHVILLYKNYCDAPWAPVWYPLGIMIKTFFFITTHRILCCAIPLRPRCSRYTGSSA